MSEWSGKKIGGYELAEEVGRGSAAIVYRAHQPQLDRWVAVKVLPYAETTDANFLERFRREARAVAALRHPNILTIFDYGEDQDVAYIVMEYVPGGSLEKRLAGEPLDYVEAIGTLLPVCEALAYAHSQGIIHRDVKPVNILLPRPSWPLLADFGLAKVIGAKRQITQPGSIMGTAVYLSPEQVSGKEVDHRTDIYSVGIVLYQLVTGKIPFERASAAESMLARVYESPVPPMELTGANVPPGLNTVILRAMERDREKRYAAMEGLIHDLQAVLRDTRPSEKSARGAVQTAPMITTHLSAQDIVVGPQLFIATSGIALPIPVAERVMVGRRDPLSQIQPGVDLDPYGGASAGVSRRHAVLLKREAGWFLEDLQSTNGTYVNEIRLAPNKPVPLHSGDLIRFGQLTLIFNES